MICAYCQRSIEDDEQRVDVLGALDTPSDAQYHPDCFNAFMENAPASEPSEES